MTMRNGRKWLLGTCATLVAWPALAQTAPETEKETGGDIVVTARRVSERLQDVPASVSVLTQETITEAGITNTAQAVRLIPGVTIVTGAAEPGDTQINIRGVNGARDAEANVALVVDGIQKSNVSFLNSPQGDLTQFEVLKGPQGAYWGRNATAGAIVISTAKPADHLEIKGRAAIGNNAVRNGLLSVSIPLSATTGLLVSGDYSHTDGFYRNTGPIKAANGPTVDAFEGYNVSARLVSKVGDRLELDAKAKYGHSTYGAINYNVVFNLPNFAGINPAFNQNVNDHVFYYDSNYASGGRQETIEASLKGDYDLDFAKLTAWVAYSDVKQDLFADGTTAAFGFFNGTSQCRASVAALHAAGYQPQAPQILGSVPDSSLFVPGGSLLGAFSATTCDGTQYQQRNQHDISGEIRLASTGSGPFSWSGGIYYLHINREDGVNVGYDKGQGILRQLFASRTSSNPTEQLSDDAFRTDAYAAFGTVDYKPVDTVTLGVALRYDREDRHVHNLVDPTARNQYINGGNQPLNVGLLNGPLADEATSYDQLEPKVSVSWHPAREVTLYANWGVGFKSGGFNNQGSQATINSAFNAFIGSGLRINDNYRKERSSAYEAGAKGSLLDGKLNLTLAGYYNDIRDMQFFEFFVGSFGILRVVSNIDRVHIKGVEASADWKLMPNWSVNLSGNYNDSNIITNAARPNTIGGKSPYTALFTVNAGTELDVPITDALTLDLRADAKVVGPTWFSTAQTSNYNTVFTGILPLAGLPAFLGTGNYTNSKRKTYTTVDLRAGLRHGDNWSVRAYVENLLNAQTIAEVIPAPEFGGSFVSPGDRRSFGAELTFKF